MYKYTYICFLNFYTQRENFCNLLFASIGNINLIEKSLLYPRHFYTPGIYAAGYIVFALTFVRSSVRMFVRSLVRSCVRSCVRSFVTFRHVRRIYHKVFG